MNTLARLRDWHLAEAARLLGNGQREIDRIPMRVSTADIATWTKQAAGHLDAVELLNAKIKGD